MEAIQLENSIVQRIKYAPRNGEHISFWIKRDDLIHKDISGNKWRKLKYNIEEAKHQKKEGILTFGGAYSNHLLATAKACQMNKLKCIGLIRGEELNPNSNSTLSNCQSMGMEFLFINRSEYRKKNDYDYLARIKSQFDNYYIVPEGGANFHGVIGCQEILQSTANDFDHVFVSAGTGTTTAGVVLSVPERTTVHSIPVLKGSFMAKDISALMYAVTYNQNFVNERMRQLTVHENYHFGGYGKWNEELIHFIQDFYKQTNVKLDPIYTGKAMFGLVDLMNKNKISSRQKILFIHTGGLQGISGVEEKLSYQLFF